MPYLPIGYQLVELGSASIIARCTNAELKMYIVAIGWLYVVMMMAAVSDSLLKGVVRFVFLGALPVGLLLWVKLVRYRAREAERAQTAETVDGTRTPDES